jgi:hypothetical protein
LVQKLPIVPTVVSEQYRGDMSLVWKGWNLKPVRPSYSETAHEYADTLHQVTGGWGAAECWTLSDVMSTDRPFVPALKRLKRILDTSPIQWNCF